MSTAQKTTIGREKEQPKLSIVTVCYNCAHMLEKTITSIMDQDSDNFEYIIVDGGSTDNTRQILKRYAGRIDCCVSEPDNGIYDAMNKGVGMSRGHYVIFMNAGDTFADGSTVGRLLSSADTDADVVYGDVIKHGADGEDIVREAEEPHNSHRMFFCHQSAMATRESLLRHPFDLSHPYSADFKFFKTLIQQKAKFQHVGFPVARFDTTGISNRRRSAGLRDNMRVIAETDNLPTRIKLTPRLLIPYLMCRLRGK